MYLVLTLPILFMCVSSGHAVICYSCTAVYGPGLPNVIPEGPCWDYFFNPDKIDSIECPGTCIYWKDESQVMFGRTSVIRGCLPQDGSCRQPGTWSPEGPQADCCSEDRCNVNGYEKTKGAKIAKFKRQTDVNRALCVGLVVIGLLLAAGVVGLLFIRGLLRKKSYNVKRAAKIHSISDLVKV